jgi:Na+/H+ antiporter NhaC
MNVMAVLTLGILLSGIIGLINGAFDIYGWLDAMGEGILNMSELIIITMMAGGLLAIIKYNGGIDFIIQRMTRHVHTKRGAELSIAGLVSFVNLCTANNTVAIITVSGIAKDISNRFSLDPRRVASILDTFSCIMQGIIPYGAQMLMGGALAGINPIEIIPHLYYPYLLCLFALGDIVLRPRKQVKYDSAEA